MENTTKIRILAGIPDENEYLKNARLKIHFIGIISYFFKTISGANSMVIA